MGRPKQDGERYPSGDLKPNKGVAPALLARLKEVAKICGNPKLASEVSVLGMKGELTNRQVATALRVGDIHNRWRRLMRLRSTPKSANLEGGFSGAADLAEERMSPEQLSDLEEAIRKASDEVKALNEQIPLYPREAAGALIDLCADNQPIASALLPEIRTALNRISHWFESKDGRRRRPVRGVRPLHLHDVKREEKPVPAFKPGDVMLRAVEQVIRKLRPDLDDDGIKLARDTVATLTARERFRAQKERAQ